MSVLDEEKFKQAAELWDLEHLYTDLATIKGSPLARTEKLHLRGLLCGYSLAVLAKKLNKDPRGVQTDVSRTISQYVKGLVNKAHPHHKPLSKLNNAGDIYALLEEAGYKKSSLSSDGVNLTIVDSVVKICKNKLSNKSIEINVFLVASLSVEQLSKVLADINSLNNPEK